MDWKNANHVVQQPTNLTLHQVLRQSQMKSKLFAYCDIADPLHPDKNNKTFNMRKLGNLFKPMLQVLYKLNYTMI